MAFVSTSLPGCFHRSHSHYFILFHPLCSSVDAASTAGVELLWLKLLENGKDWQSQPCGKHHLLSLFLSFGSVAGEEWIFPAKFDTWEKQFEEEREMGSVEATEGEDEVREQFIEMWSSITVVSPGACCFASAEQLIGHFCISEVAAFISRLSARPDFYVGS